jgi:hypothetical protein
MIKYKEGGAKRIEERETEGEKKRQGKERKGSHREERDSIIARKFCRKKSKEGKEDSPN